MPAGASGEATTYLLKSDELAEVVDLRAALQARGVSVPAHRAALVAADGHRIELPEQVFKALRDVVSAMAQGQAVTIAPHDTLLTTQEAADFLSVSRPTLVRLLEGGEIAFEKRGRHRRVMLCDLLEYKRVSRHERRETLAEMARQGMEDGVYKATSGPPVQTR